jgi:hypothetical protein
LETFTEKGFYALCAQVAEHDEETADDEKALYAVSPADQPERFRFRQRTEMVEHDGVGQEETDKVEVVPFLYGRYGFFVYEHDVMWRVN